MPKNSAITYFGHSIWIKMVTLTSRWVVLYIYIYKNNTVQTTAYTYNMSISWTILLNFPRASPIYLPVKGRQMNFTQTPSDRSMKYQLLLFMRRHHSSSRPTSCNRQAGVIKIHEFRSVTGISISHRRHVIRYTRRKTKMGVQNVRRGRQRCHWYSRDDENRSGMIY